MRRIEQALHAACVRILRTAFPDVLAIHCPNGGARSKIEAAIFKSLGVVAGVPDLLIFEPGNGAVGLAIEFKSDKGRCTKSQTDFQELLRKRGWRVELVRTTNEFTEAVCSHLGVRR